MRTMKQWKLNLRLYWSTFLSYFKKKEKDQDVFIYENDDFDNDFKDE